MMSERPFHLLGRIRDGEKAGHSLSSVAGTSMAEGDSVGALAEATVSSFLRRMPGTAKIEDVREEPKWRERGVDMLWHLGGRTLPLLVEVKGDRVGKANFFLEEISNSDKGTTGCFLATKSDWFAYLFTKTAELYLIPTDAAHEWATRRFMDFDVGVTDTYNDHGQLMYHTTGRKVPRTTLIREIPSILGPLDMTRFMPRA